MRSAIAVCSLVVAFVLASPLSAAAQPAITTTPIADGVYVVHTAIPNSYFNMNNLVVVDPDAVTLVDTLPPPTGLYFFLSPAIKAVTGGRSVDAIINTSWHFDHVGLVDQFRLKDGTNTIIAHWRTGDYLLVPHCMEDLADCSQPSSWTPAFPGAMPTQVVHGEKTLALENELLTIKTLENAHSGADLFVYLQRANVMYTGDIYFGGMYPIIDRTGGGTLNGVLDALRKVLARIDDDTVVVPSHGAIGNRQTVVAFLDMLETSRREVRALIARGATEQEVMFNPSFAGMDAIWGGSNAFIPGPIFRRIVYRELAPRGK